MPGSDRLQVPRRAQQGSRAAAPAALIEVDLGEERRSHVQAGSKAADAHAGRNRRGRRRARRFPGPLSLTSAEADSSNRGRRAGAPRGRENRCAVSSKRILEAPGQQASFHCFPLQPRIGGAELHTIPQGAHRFLVATHLEPTFGQEKARLEIAGGFLNRRPGGKDRSEVLLLIPGRFGVRIIACADCRLHPGEPRKNRDVDPIYAGYSPADGVIAP